MMKLFRPIVIVATLLLASGCGCMLEDGDSTNVSDYIDGCWADAKGNPNEV